MSAEGESLTVTVPIDLYHQLLWGLRSGTPLWERAVAISRQWATDNPESFGAMKHYPTDGPFTVIEYTQAGSDAE